jgi:hypothetical protein
MNEIEQLAITFALEGLQLVIKNATLKAEVQSQMLGIANLIYETYGLVPPTQTAPTATT